MDEPAVSFNQAALKIKWAEILIDQLNRHCTSFVDEKSYTVVFKRDAEIGSYFFKVGLTRQVPPEIPLLMGDICSNLRAALDYAWTGLVRKEHPGYAHRCTLPIADNRKGLKSTIAKSLVKAAANEAEVLLVDRIKSHRDYANGGNTAIVALNELSNWNKHNLLIASVGVTNVPSVTLSSDSGLTFKMSGLKVRGGVCSLAQIVVPNAEISYDGDPTVDIVFGKHDFVGDEPVIPTLANLAQASLQALHAFCEAFPSPLNPAIS